MHISPFGGEFMRVAQTGKTPSTSQEVDIDIYFLPREDWGGRVAAGKSALWLREKKLVSSCYTLLAQGDKKWEIELSNDTDDSSAPSM